MCLDENGRNLTKNQLKSIPLILEAKSITEGVKKARLSKSTFYEWHKNPEYKAELIRQRQESVELALHELKTSANEAVTVLRALLKAESETVRLRTALGILEHIGKFIELEKLEGRIEELERSIGE